MASQPKPQKPMQFLLKYLFEFAVVFAGVFLAFWLTERNDQKKVAQKQKDIYLAIYEDLRSFHESGIRSNEEGFVVRFEQWDDQLDSLVAHKKIPLKLNFRGDYWKMPIIYSMIQSGIMNDIDIATFKRVSRVYTVHQNFLKMIEDFNQYYDQYITAEYDQGMDHFYVPGTNQLKKKYSYLNQALTEIAKFAELMVEITGETATEIKKDHLDRYK